MWWNQLLCLSTTSHHSKSVCVMWGNTVTCVTANASAIKVMPLMRDRIRGLYMLSIRDMMMNFPPRAREIFCPVSQRQTQRSGNKSEDGEREREHAYLKKSKATRERKKKGKVRSPVIRGRKEVLYNSYGRQNP